MAQARAHPYDPNNTKDVVRNDQVSKKSNGVFDPPALFQVDTFLSGGGCRGPSCLRSSEFAFPIIVHDASHTTIQACFTPGSKCQNLLVKLLDGAREEILVQTYSFTAKPLKDALIRAKARGVSVSVIADHGQQTAPYSRIPELGKAGIPVTYDHTVAIAHNKIMIIDNKTVATGSYNFTNAAEHKNAENMLIIQNKSLVDQYKKNWQDRHNAAEAKKRE
jgi:phosphatidylserine/phosphatidylglycerophosphate/cardiolipin synthase-like enzyme